MINENQFNSLIQLLEQENNELTNKLINIQDLDEKIKELKRNSKLNELLTLLHQYKNNYIIVKPVKDDKKKTKK